jgi:hypothetical protein
VPRTRPSHSGTTPSEPSTCCSLVCRGDETGQALRRLGLDAGGVRADVRRIVGGGPMPDAVFDADALDSIGIDLKAVRERVEAAFGDGALERALRRTGSCGGGAFGVTPGLKQALAQALQEAARRGAQPTTADVALGLALRRDSLAAGILDAHAISPDRLRAALSASRG